MWDFGKAAAVDFEGAAVWWLVSVTATGTGWGFASGAGVFAGGAGTADRSSAGGGETDGGANSAAAVALEPCAFVAVVPEVAWWAGPLRLRKEGWAPRSSLQGPQGPGGSVVPLETNLVESPAINVVMNAEGT